LKQEVNFIQILLGLLMLLAVEVYPQKLQVKAGFGNFEGFNIGMTHLFNRYLLEYGIGNDLNLYGQGYCNSMYIVFGRSIFPKRNHPARPLYFTIRSLLCNIENSSNVFTSVSFSPGLQKQIRLNPWYQAGIYAGFVWSGVIRYERKNYDDVGFIKVWYPNFGISIYRKIR
jgi:hypothetical protein